MVRGAYLGFDAARPNPFAFEISLTLWSLFRNGRRAMGKHALAIALSLMALPVSAEEDHLWPDGSIIGGTEYVPSYDENIHSMLRDAYGPNVVARMVTDCDSVCSLSYPGPGPYAVGLASKRPSGRAPPYGIFAINFSSVPIPDDPYLARAETSISTVKRCDADISQPLADRIVAVWRAMLLQTRYPARSGLDGQNYHFYFGGMAGQVWSPNQDSAASNLVALAYTMGSYCNKEPGVGEAELSKVTSELEARLK
jgi:hypothetical protein